MELFGMEKLSLVDYDGKVAATVFTGTCNFRCHFCHNGPLVNDVNSLKPISTEEVFSYLNKRKGIIEGVCVTGGEPTLQKDLPSFCKQLKNIGLSVKLDTNGTNPDMVKLLAENGLADYFAMDIKSDKLHYGDIIDVKNYDTSKVEKTVDFFLTNNYDYEFRTTIINEFHNDEIMENVGKWLNGAKKYFLQKFKEVKTCIAHNLTEVSDDDAKRYLEIVKKYVANSKLRGYDIG